MPSIKVLAEGRRRTKPFHFGVWLSLVRALALGARGPEFKSLYPDLEKINIGSHSNLFWI